MRKAGMMLALLVAAILGLMAAKTWLVDIPAARTDAAPGQFDAARAKARLVRILGDQRPHPADTDASDALRAHLVAELRAIGLTPIVRDQMACNQLYKQRGVTCARVRNVIARLGPVTGKALLLNAHHDSTPVGPGAGDDGAGVATLLEVGAVLQGKTLHRPLILLFNEGEELGLLGARAFLADPLSGSVDSLVNLEARGVRGPVNMFETSVPNAGAIAVFARTSPHPVANSLSTDVYRLMPNYTDVNTLSERGWLTLNLAMIGNETRYHSAGDDVAALDPASLQHMGDQVLALSTGLDLGVPAAGSTSIFMDVAGKILVRLPLALGVVLLAGLLLGLLIVAIKRGGLARGVAMVAGTLVGSALISFVLLALIGLIHPGMFWRAHPIWALLTTYAAATAVGIALLRTLAAELTVGQLRASFWLSSCAIGAMVGLSAPGGIIFFLFPPLIALGGMVAARWWRPAEAIGALLAIAMLYLTWGAMLALLEELLNSGPIWLFAPLGALIVVPLLIEGKRLVDSAGTRLGAIIAGGVSLALAAIAAAVPAYSADRQQRFVIQHVTDAASGKAQWSLLGDGAPLPAALGKHWHRGTLPIAERQRWLHDALAQPSERAPQVAVLSSVGNGTERTVTLRLTANGAEDIDLIAPEDARIRSAGTAGFVRPIDPGLDGKYDLECYGRSCDGLVLTMTIGKPGPVALTVIGSRPTLPPSAAPLLKARPRFARAQYAPDSTIIFARQRI